MRITSVMSTIYWPKAGPVQAAPDAASGQPTGSRLKGPSGDNSISFCVSVAIVTRTFTPTGVLRSVDEAIHALHAMIQACWAYKHHPTAGKQGRPQAL